MWTAGGGRFRPAAARGQCGPGTGASCLSFGNRRLVSADGHLTVILNWPAALQKNQCAGLNREVANRFGCWTYNPRHPCPLTAGVRLGHYEIQEPGAGGKGEV